MESPAVLPRATGRTPRLGIVPAVRVLGHRGSAARPDRPENTLAAVRAALDGGAAGVEVDVRRTADGVLVCSHDPDLGRVSGRPGGGLAVAATAWPQLRAALLPGGHRVARLEEVLDLAAARSAVVVAEVKPVPGPRRLSTAQALAGLLRARRQRRPGADRVTTSSFDPLAAAALVGCGSTAALLVEPWTPVVRAVRMARDAGCAELHLPVQVLRRDPSAVGRVRESGLQVVVWTVNRPDEVRQARVLGAAGVITDHPAAVARDLGVQGTAASGGAAVRRRRGALAAPR